MELLQAFGLPYIVVPSEAEAQCAMLERLRVVDGIVTEDSDTFLFGAETVYKNLFQDSKYVEVCNFSLSWCVLYGYLCRHILPKTSRVSLGLTSHP